MNKTQRFFVFPFATFALIAGLAACDKDGPAENAGEKIDNAMSSSQSSYEAAKNDIRQGVGDAQQAASNALDTTKVAIADTAITTSVLGELAKDDKLSALKIDVDTSGGNVVLKGKAPDATSKARATSLAQNVDGVVNVDNQLMTP